MKTKKSVSSTPSLQRKKLFLPLFLAGLMVFSVFAVVLSSFGPTPDDTTTITTTYKGYEFTSTTSGWTTTIKGQPFLIQSHPDTLQSFQAPELPLLTPLLTAQKIYLSVPPEHALHTPLSVLYTNLRTRFNNNAFLACTADGEGCEDLPLKTCADATTTAPVLVLDLAENDNTLPKMTIPHPHCYTFTAPSTTFMPLVNHFLFTLYTV